jgi:hypothetical protein
VRPDERLQQDILSLKDSNPAVTVPDGVEGADASGVPSDAAECVAGGGCRQAADCAADIPQDVLEQEDSSAPAETAAELSDAAPDSDSKPAETAGGDGDAATGPDSADGGGGPYPECCKDTDCDDDNPCTVDTCVGSQCEHESDPAAAGCCASDADCDDGDLSTSDACESFRCQHSCQESCCWISEDCDDGNPCTCDHCEFGVCYHSLEPGLDPFCAPPPAECCASAQDCDDADACTLDACDAGSCMHSAQPWLPGCCAP